MYDENTRTVKIWLRTQYKHKFRKQTDARDEQFCIPNTELFILRIARY